MNDLVSLHFEQSDIRMVMLDSAPWWVLADVAPLMGLRNPSKLAGRLEDYQKDAIPMRDTMGRWQTVIIVNEAGIYQLLGSSPKLAAKQFMRWVFTEVLPSIRVYGQYPPPQYAIEDADRAQDRQSTPQDRFIAECKRVASDQGVTVEQLLKHIVSPQERRAIEMGKGPMADLLHKARRWEAFIGVGMDLNYILSGVWTNTPQERRVVAQMRAARVEQLRFEA